MAWRKYLSSTEKSKARKKAWQQVRDRFVALHIKWCLIKSGPVVCMKCGSRRTLDVDHVRASKGIWALKLNILNLQRLCRICNDDKGSVTADYRPEGFLEFIKRETHHGRDS